MGWFNKLATPQAPATTPTERARKHLEIWSTATVPRNPRDVIPMVLIVVMDGWDRSHVEAIATDGVPESDVTAIAGLLREYQLDHICSADACAAALITMCQQAWARHTV